MKLTLGFQSSSANSTNDEAVSVIAALQATALEKNEISNKLTCKLFWSYLSEKAPPPDTLCSSENDQCIRSAVQLWLYHRSE